DFVPQALAAGAAASFCARARHDAVLAACRAGAVPAGPALLVVEDPEMALLAWAKARRAEWAGELIGIAGSNGKTTTKEMLAAIRASLPRGAPLVVPGDEPRLEAWVRPLRARLVTFALVPGSDFVAHDIVSLGEAGMRFSVQGFPPLTVPVPGRHSVSNALAA